MKPFHFFIVVVSFVLFSSFSSELLKDKKETLVHDGIKRSYLVHLPKNYTPTKTYPLVLALHGGSGTAKRFNRSTRNRFNELADEEGFILVYPQGVQKSWNDNNKRNQLGAARKQNIDDVGFIRKMIEKLESNYPIQSKNIFSCGISNGGLMSQTLAAQLPEKIKAIGMVASNFSQAQVDEMQDSKPFSIIMINGTEDPIFPYSEGEIKVFKKSRGKVIGVKKSIKFMLKLNGNEQSGLSRTLPNPSIDDGCSTIQTVYPNPENPNLRVEQIDVIGGGHTWPGGYQYLPKKLVGRVSKDFNACDAIWTFFKSLLE